MQRGVNGYSFPEPEDFGLDNLQDLYGLVESSIDSELSAKMRFYMEGEEESYNLNLVMREEIDEGKVGELLEDNLEDSGFYDKVSLQEQRWDIGHDYGFESYRVILTS